MTTLIKWVLTYERTQISSKGETVDTLETSSFLDLGEAEDARFSLDQGEWDSISDSGAGVVYKSISLEPQEFELEEEA